MKISKSSKNSPQQEAQSNTLSVDNFICHTRRSTALSPRFEWMVAALPILAKVSVKSYVAKKLAEEMGPRAAALSVVAGTGFGISGGMYLAHEICDVIESRARVRVYEERMRQKPENSHPTPVGPTTEKNDADMIGVRELVEAGKESALELSRNVFGWPKLQDAQLEIENRARSKSALSDEDFMMWARHAAAPSKLSQSVRYAGFISITCVGATLTMRKLQFGNRMMRVGQAGAFLVGYSLAWLGIYARQQVGRVDLLESRLRMGALAR